MQPQRLVDAPPHDHSRRVIVHVQYVSATRGDDQRRELQRIPSRIVHEGGVSTIGRDFYSRRGPRLGGTKVVTFGIRAVRSAQRLLTHAPALPTSSIAPPPSILSSSSPGTASSSFTSCWKAAMGMERLDWSHRDGPQSEALRTAIGLCSGFPRCSNLSHDDTRLAHAQQALNARRNPI